MQIPIPPVHVQSGFGVSELTPHEVGPAWDCGWRFAETVLSPVPDHPRAAWSGKVRESLDPDGVRIARPLRTSDGRHVMAGWQARFYIPGAPAPRVDEVVGVALRLSEALAQLSRPRFLTEHPTMPLDEVDVFAVAESAAWAPDPIAALEGYLDATVVPRTDVAEALRLAGRLADRRQDIHLPDQIVHADLLATTIFADTATPAVTDLVPVWRPAQWSAALVVVDGLNSGSVDDGIIERWRHLPEWPQLLLRALLYRLFVHCLHPAAKESAWRGLHRAGTVLEVHL